MMIMACDAFLSPKSNDSGSPEQRGGSSEGLPPSQLLNIYLACPPSSHRPPQLFQDKISFLRGYRFNVCFENASHPGQKG